MATIIGVVSGVLTIFSFLQDNFPASDGSSSQMRIAVGLDATEGLDNAGGDAPDIRLFNENGGFLGANYDPGFIENGAFGDFTVNQDAAQQPTYALFSGNTDAVCIAYLSQTWPDGQNYGWLGNWGRRCDVSWYYSGVVLDGQDLECTWLDGNGDATDITGFQVHFPDFKQEDGASNPSVEEYCSQGPSMRFYTEPDPNSISFFTRKRSYPPKRNSSTTVRRQSSTNSTSENRLVKSSKASQNATNLCQSATSRGPNFVSMAEKKFCNMQTREILSFCTGANETKCFDPDTDTERSGNGSVPLRTSYGSPINWD